ncbi:uncharacterized protein MYCFIDRAFT_182764 [Pseudocercospora fijiensis CIRAD86]|uniref:Uncharacterized protein n=1 Tax=Pseudocercospora fijiensis (strain CIRAD86) TaxID=383855 RepID=M2Z0C4_PSEFD|nr:uncharacterized protein MYCFIDRAFT_182764 [Pseudocercospora fijiensis CIRAD86]EME83270.1 hypothetical protein MYCFIDRAFT_182764 [Pseudocercospora fijiensis CIRAD86]
MSILPRAFHRCTLPAAPVCCSTIGASWQSGKLIFTSLLSWSPKQSKPIKVAWSCPPKILRRIRIRSRSKWSSTSVTEIEIAARAIETSAMLQYIMP